MMFREHKVDEVKILRGKSMVELEQEIKRVGEDYVFIDLQFGVDSADFKRKFYALTLLKKK